MALSASTVWEIRTAGSDTNGGGFVTGASGTDWSQQDSAQYALTNGVATTGSAVITTTSAVADMVGNIAYVAGGSGSITGGWYQIISQVTGVSITVDRSTGLVTGTGVTINIGGALGSPGLVGSVWVSGNKAWVKNGTYTLGSGSANVSGGTVLVSTGIFVSMEGYNATRGDLISPPTIINAAFTSINIISQTSGRFYIANIIVDGNSKTGTVAFNLNVGNSLAYLCTAQNCTGNGFTNGGALGRTFCVGCIATACSVGFFWAVCIDCEAYSNTSSGFASCSASWCLAYSNGVGGFNAALTSCNCIAYNNTGVGFIFSANGAALNCYAESNTTYGFQGDNNAGDMSFLINCGAYNNTSGAVNPATLQRSIPALVVPSSSAFVNAGASNFALNNTIGAGATLQAVGLPGAYPRGLTTGYVDIGAAQHQNTPATFIFPVFD